MTKDPAHGGILFLHWECLPRRLLLVACCLFSFLLRSSSSTSVRFEIPVLPHNIPMHKNDGREQQHVQEEVDLVEGECREQRRRAEPDEGRQDERARRPGS